MPNWVRNVVKADGLHQLPIFTEGSFDFDKIIPRPESLNVQAGSGEEEDIMYYLTEKCTVPLICLTDGKADIASALIHNSFSKGKEWKQEIFQRAMATAFKLNENEKENMYQMGKTYVENFQKYGHTTWYEWDIENWGTKWNACDTEMMDNNIVIFDTAWSSPLPVMLKLSEMFLKVEFEHWYADEDIGSNTGYFVYKDGEIIGGCAYDRCSNEAFETYIHCWGNKEGERG